MASKLTILKGRMRLCKSRLGSIFLVLLGVASILCVINLLTSTVFKKDDSVAEFEGGGRRLAQLPGGDHILRKGHHRRRRPKPDSEFDNQVCVAPKLSLETDTNKDAYHTMEPLVCHGNFLFSLKDSILRLNHTELKKQKILKCDYRAIDRITDNVHTYSTMHTRKKDFEIKVKNDFFRVECYIEGSTVSHKAYREGGKFDDYQRRRLLQFEDIVRRPAKKIVRKVSDPNLPQPVENNAPNNAPVASQGDTVRQHSSPKLLGSMGLPDFPDTVLHNQALLAQNNVNKADDDTKNAKPDPGREGVRKALEGNKANHQNVEKPQENIQNGNQNMDHDSNKEKAQNQNILVAGDDQKEVENEPHEEIQFNMQQGEEDYSMLEDDYGMLQPDYEQFFAQVYPKEEVLERVQTLKPFINSTQMNVLIFALDSMSHLSYQRKLPKTYDYLKKALGSVVMSAYNIVGDATIAALIPIFTGHSELELPEVRINKPGTHYVDIYPFIWNKFEQSGYVTLYAEDQPSMGTFQLRDNGFEEVPVDHYMRPFWQAALSSSLHQDSPQYCLGGKTEHQYTLDYIKDFFGKYQSLPKFAFGFLGELSHADNNPVEYIDEDLVELLEHLKTDGHLDNTLVIVMGDHGARYSKVRHTTQGKLEERLPFMSLALPKVFKEKYPQLANNLRANKNRLTTPFDLHETLASVLNVYNAEKPVKYTDRGISMLKPIPLNRTCESAGIQLHWCSCMKYEVLNTDDLKVQNVAKYLLNNIKDRTALLRDRCEELTLKSIRDAQIIFPNEMVLKYLRSIDGDQRIANFSETIKLDIVHYQLTIETMPNGGLFEATIQIIVKDGVSSIIGDISRINKYGDQPHCITKDHPDLRKYCYCKVKPPEKPTKITKRKSKVKQNNRISS